MRHRFDLVISTDATKISEAWNLARVSMPELLANAAITPTGAYLWFVVGPTGNAARWPDQAAFTEERDQLRLWCQAKGLHFTTLTIDDDTDRPLDSGVPVTPT